MSNDPGLAYRQTAALSSEPVELVVVLYDMLLKDIRDALLALSAGNIERRAEAIRHGMLVLQQLQGSIDRERGGIVAENLDRFYNFTRSKLLEGQIKASAEIFEQQILFVASIRDAWRAVGAKQVDGNGGSADTEGPSNPPLLPLPEPAAASEWSA